MANLILEYVDAVIEGIKNTKGRSSSKAGLRKILLRNSALADLVELDISPEDVASFINDVEVEEHFPDYATISLLGNRSLHRLIALRELEEDEDKFFERWQSSSDRRFYPSVWQRKGKKGS